MSYKSKSFQSVEFKTAEDAPEGSIKAVFSVFDVPDREGDIVRASAFTDGQEVPMVWAHDWAQPIGKGAIRVEKNRAVFDGQFNLNTTAGRDAYESVKFAGDLQEYSWGFRVLDVQPNKDIAGYDITKAEVFEVSPVLVGANQYTQTLAVKSGQCPTCGHVKSDEPPTESTTEAPDADKGEREKVARLALAAAALEVTHGHLDSVA